MNRFGEIVSLLLIEVKLFVVALKFIGDFDHLLVVGRFESEQ